jgi:hypothetical protein
MKDQIIAKKIPLSTGIALDTDIDDHKRFLQQSLERDPIRESWIVI